MTDAETKVVLAVFDSLIKTFQDEELHRFLGSITIEDMKKLYYKLKYADYCARRGISYDDMTDEDFLDAYLEQGKSSEDIEE